MFLSIMKLWQEKFEYGRPPQTLTGKHCYSLSKSELNVGNLNQRQLLYINCIYMYSSLHQWSDNVIMSYYMLLQIYKFLVDKNSSLHILCNPKQTWVQSGTLGVCSVYCIVNSHCSSCVWATMRIHSKTLHGHDTEWKPW